MLQTHTQKIANHKNVDGRGKDSRLVPFLYKSVLDIIASISLSLPLNRNPHNITSFICNPHHLGGHNQADLTLRHIVKLELHSALQISR
jgi:hypothetical protein